MRLFVGVELDERVREAATVIAESLRRELGARIDARWIASSNLHITLSFLGEVDEFRAERVIGALGPEFGERPFEMELEGLGAFPPSGAPRVFWLGVTDGAASLSRLNHELTARLEPIGFQPEQRTFSAHLTIARVRGVLGGASYRDIRQLLRTIPAHAGRCRIQAVTLFRSHLSPKGATYEALLRVPLK
jgi:2'-5' RNA ligase